MADRYKSCSSLFPSSSGLLPIRPFSLVLFVYLPKLRCGYFYPAYCPCLFCVLSLSAGRVRIVLRRGDMQEASSSCFAIPALAFLSALSSASRPDGVSGLLWDGKESIRRWWMVNGRWRSNAPKRIFSFGLLYFESIRSYLPLFVSLGWPLATIDQLED